MSIDLQTMWWVISISAIVIISVAAFIIAKFDKDEKNGSKK